MGWCAGRAAVAFGGAFYAYIHDVGFAPVILVAENLLFMPANRLPVTYNGGW